MCDFLEAICPCLRPNQQPEDSYDVIPEKGTYQGRRDITGSRHGKGIYRFDNGDIYEGEWKKDKKHGLGEYRFNDGKILNGYFENDRFIGKNPPAGYKPSSSSDAQPLLAEDIKCDQKPVTVKQSNIGYSFAQIAGELKQSAKKKKKKGKHKDETDHQAKIHEDRQRLLTKQQEIPVYTQPYGQIDPQMAERIEQERYRKERERQQKHRERTERIRKKYNLGGNQVPI
eukprot:gene18091-19898_t